jgi:hypothetical protein
MANYQDRLDRIEAVLLPQTNALRCVVYVNVGQTEQEAVVAYAEARGLTIAEVNANMICVHFVSAADSRL